MRRRPGRDLSRSNLVRIALTDARRERSNQTLRDSAARLAQTYALLRRSRPPPDPVADIAPPVFACPICRQTLTFHNDRIEPTANGRPEKVGVFFCIHHGFFHVSENQPLRPCM